MEYVARREHYSQRLHTDPWRWPRHLLVVLALTSSASGAGAMLEEGIITDILKVRSHTEALLGSITIEVEYHDWLAPGTLDESQRRESRRVEKVGYAYDADGRVRVQTEVAEYDELGVIRPRGHTITHVWDLQREMLLDRGPSIKSLSIKRENSVSAIRKPTDFSYSAGPRSVASLMSSAMAAGLPMHVAKADDGRGCVLEVPQVVNNQKWEYRFWLDPEKLYYAYRADVFVDGRLWSRKESTPTEIGDGIWIPKEASHKHFGPSGEVTLDTKMFTKQVNVSSERLPDALFRIELEPGMLVGDARGETTVEYVYGASDVANNLLQEIAAAALKDDYVERALPETAGPRRGSNTQQEGQRESSEPNSVSTQTTGEIKPQSLAESRGSRILPVLAFVGVLGVCLLCAVRYLQKNRHRHRDP